MWIVIFVIFGPIIYVVVSIIIDSISYKIKEIKQKKYYGEKEIIYISTHNNDITENDIMLLFNSQFEFYRQHYFYIDYKVYNDKEDQNYAWSIKTTKQTFGWGIVYNIRFHFSNGCVCLSFSNRSFTIDGQSSHEYYIYGFNYGSGKIKETLDICREEARIKWKMNGKEPKESFPFNYIPLSSNRSSSNNNRTKNKKEEKSSHENTNQFDLLSFYRNLLGLKLRFSHDELKKSYREAVGKYHPDRYGTSSQRDRENAEMLMKQVNEAYEKLKEIAE